MERKVIGFVAHVDSGKTTLSEAVLYSAGRLKTLGRVDRRDAFLDNNALERERGITIFSKQAVFETGDVAVTLLDTPGHVDFSTEMERVLSVLDAAVLVISGPEGIEAHTRTLWRLLKTYDVPTIIFVNKMDRCEQNEEEILAKLEAELSGDIVPVGGLMGWNSDGGSIDRSLVSDILERISLCDENLMNSYLETETMSDEQIADCVGNRKLFPCLFGSALKVEGIDELLECMRRFIPGTDYDETGEFSGSVFKVSYDENGKRLTHIKVTGGALKTRDTLSYKGQTKEQIKLTRAGATQNSSEADEEDSEEPEEYYSEKISEIREYSGAGYRRVDEALPGMVIAIPGLPCTFAGQGFGDEETLCTHELVPVMTYAVLEKDKSKLLSIVPKLRILEEEDPELSLTWNASVSELQVNIMGDIRLEILKRELKDRFGLELQFGPGSVLYKESLAAPVYGVGHFEPLRHYAETILYMEPGERGSGITVDTILSTNDLDLNWQRLIMTHVTERTHKGVLTGAALTDVHFTIVAGRAHLKHTQGGDFRQATYRAVRQGLMKAAVEGACIILEPYYEITIEIPRENIGRTLHDIDSAYGRVISQEEAGNDMVAIKAVAPVSTMQGYAAQVTSYTKGLGSFFCSYFGYFPCHNQQEVYEAAGYNPLNDLRNPAGSVFCSHGAGIYVEWDEVDAMRHTEPVNVLREESDEENSPCVGNSIAISSGRVRGTGDDGFIGTEEIDEIMNRLHNSNRRDKERVNPYRKHKRDIYATDGRRVSSGASGNDNASRKTPGGEFKDSREKYLLVDGYNIIFSWDELKELAAVNIDSARDRLNDILINYRGMHDINLIVVYDAYRVVGHNTEFFKFHNIGVVFTKEAETADKYIERFAHENASRYDVTVATSDGLEQIIIRGAGCKLMTSRDLQAEVKNSHTEMKDRFGGEMESKPLGSPLLIKNYVV